MEYLLLEVKEKNQLEQMRKYGILHKKNIIFQPIKLVN